MCLKEDIKALYKARDLLIEHLEWNENLPKAAYDIQDKIRELQKRCTHVVFLETGKGVVQCENCLEVRFTEPISFKPAIYLYQGG